MALRVLLADESQTIKKVIQLALQDFSVEVKPVHSGIDVLPIAKVFQPDLIFIDVLLAKKSGYDVSKELKNNPDTGSIPIVLMWNSLMGIDEKKAQESKADRRLEKPFEVETLRQLVQELAPKTVSNPISSFLNFGEIESFKEMNPSQEAPKRTSNSDFLVKPPAEEHSTDDSENSYEEILELGTDEDDFAQVQLTPNITLPDNLSTEDSSSINEPQDEWAQQKIETISELPPENFSLEENFSLPEEDDLKNAKIKVTENFEEIIFEDDIDSSGVPKAPSIKLSTENSQGD
ncbi:MAG: response regulator, partial [Bdellovibrionales bacterium]|nr:response regulator [Bdellovibrionales bacterium]